MARWVSKAKRERKRVQRGECAAGEDKYLFRGEGLISSNIHAPRLVLRGNPPAVGKKTLVVFFDKHSCPGLHHEYVAYQHGQGLITRGH